MAGKKVRKTTPKRRRLTGVTTTRKKATKKRATRKLDDAKAQLEVYHDPFSVATAQPKIPDGRVHRSLGLSNQSAGEIVISTPFVGQGAQTPKDGVLHMIVYGGQSTGAVIWNSTEGEANASLQIYNSTIPAVSFMDYESTPDISFNQVSPGGGELLFTNNYAQWRLVSQGLKLGLLNPAETDDGWWECVRLKEPMDTDEYCILPKNRLNSTAQGTITPRFLIDDLKNRNLSNQPTYETGLLRDIHKREFQLMPTYKDHEFQQQMDQFDLEDQDVLLSVISGVGEQGRYITFDDGRDNVRQLINMFIDPSFDMMYIRIHGRTDSQATRLHYNMVSNQEVTFSSNNRESRFQSETENRPLEVVQAKKKLHSKKAQTHRDKMH